jgi:hypothetical protein
VQEDLSVGPPVERRREFTAANLQAESYLECERNARWAALSIAQATSCTSGQCMDITFPTQHSRARPAQSLPTRCAEQGGGTMAKSGADHNFRLLNVDASPQEGMIFNCAGQASGGW